MWYARTIRSVVVVSTLAAAAACGGPDGPTPLRTVEHEVARAVDSCRPGDPGCSWVRIVWLDAQGGRDAARVAVQDWIRAHVLEPLGDHWAVENPEDVVEAFLADRTEFLEDFPDAATGDWFLEREVRRLDAPAGIVSLEFHERLYTGGAHGMEGIRLASFDEATGAILGLSDLVPPGWMDAFRAAADRALREDRGLTAEQDLREAGFFLEDDALPPTDNVARVDAGVRLHFDAYEIAPYSMGPTDLVVPIEHP